MKIKIYFLLLLFLCISVTGNTQTLLVENFNYPAGDSIGAYGWVAFSGSVNNILVKSPGLIYTNYPLSGIGNCCRIRNNGIDNYKNSSAIITSGNIYVSFMVKVDSVQGIGDYFLALLPSNSTTNYFARVFAKDTLGALYFGVSKSSISTTTFLPTWGTTGFNLGTTYLIILKYTFNTGSTTDDVVSLFVFTSPNLPLTEPSTPYAGPVTTTQTDPQDFGRVALRQGTASIAPTLDLDGIKVALTWSDILLGLKNNRTMLSSFELFQNYPNPFNNETIIRFNLPEINNNSNVTLKIFDIMGREVLTLINNPLNAGSYEYRLNANELSSGMYYYKLSAGEYSEIKKMVVVK
ncbi:MAG: T9SS type A sorting domain-containing protein [Ignavibacteria bacterium]|nr:T9SS type A sorting domain-containing protein [Ignavibacteria bacterium]